MIERQAIRRRTEILAECPVNGVCVADDHADGQAVQCGYCNDILDDNILGGTTVQKKGINK